jgi:hypothetical protein
MALIVSLTLATPVTAKIYKWVDDEGRTHMGDTIPAKYANKDRVEMDKSGRVVKTTKFLTKEELKAKKEAEAKELAAQKIRKAQKRYDDTLLYTYSNSDEIDLARHRNLQQVNARVSSSESQIEIIKNTLQDLKDETAARTKAGKPVSASLEQDIAQTKERLLKVRQGLKNYQAEKETLDARYDADKARYQELTGR